MDIKEIITKKKEEETLGNVQEKVAEKVTTIEKTTKTRLNVREQPSLLSTIVRTLNYNEKVEVLESAGGWAKISDGYCKENFLF